MLLMLMSMLAFMFRLMFSLRLWLRSYVYGYAFSHVCFIIAEKHKAYTNKLELTQNCEVAISSHQQAIASWLARLSNNMQTTEANVEMMWLVGTLQQLTIQVLNKGLHWFNMADNKNQALNKGLCCVNVTASNSGPEQGLGLSKHQINGQFKLHYSIQRLSWALRFVCIDMQCLAECLSKSQHPARNHKKRNRTQTTNTNVRI